MRELRRAAQMPVRVREIVMTTSFCRNKRYRRSAHIWHALSMDHTILPATYAFIYEWNELYLPLPS